MSFITLDFETPYRSAKNKTTEGARYSLADPNMTYERYIRDKRFQVFGVGIKIDADKTYWIHGDSNVRAHLEKLFVLGNNHTMLAHNCKFDGAILSWYFGLAASRYLCTMDMARAVWPTLSASLKNVTKRIWPNDPTKWKGTELEDVNGYMALNDEQYKFLGDYCIQDVDVTFNTFAFIYAFFPDSELDVIDLTLQMFIHPCFIADRTRIQNHLDAVNDNRTELVEDSEVCEKAVDSKIILSSDAKFAKYIQDVLDIPIEKVPSPTKKNPDNTKWPLSKDSQFMISMRRDHSDLDHVWLARIAVKSTTESSRAERLLDHSIPSHINPVGWIAAALVYYGAHTGRFSGTNRVNFQNFGAGSELRKSLCAPDGHLVDVVDLSNIEGRMLAWFAGQKEKLQAFRDGRDIYNDLGTTLFGYPIDRKNNPEHGQQGHVAKTAELGLGYNMGWRTLQAQFASGIRGSEPLYLDEQECRRIVNLWRQKNYRIADLWKVADKIIAAMCNKNTEPFVWKCLTVEHQRLKLPNGLYLVYPNLRYDDDHDDPFDCGYVYWNGKFEKNLYGGLLIENIIQAISRIILTDAMVKVSQDFKALDARIALTVHDEIISVVPTIHIEEAHAIKIKHLTQPPAWCNDGSLVLDTSGGWDKVYSK